MKIRSGCMAAGITLLSLGMALAQTVATGEGGRSLYTFDQDTGGVSTCYDQCAQNWPPYLGDNAADKGPGWTLVRRNDGTMQWAHNGKPAYYFVGDANPGDVNGDGRAGVWHLLTE